MFLQLLRLLSKSCIEIDEDSYVIMEIDEEDIYVSLKRVPRTFMNNSSRQRNRRSYKWKAIASTI